MGIPKPTNSATGVVNGYATIDWSKTVYLCSDIYCTCDDQTHHCTHGSESAQHARCPHCKKVLRLGDRVQLFRDEKGCNNELSRPHAFVQWKGTGIFMKAHCPCGAEFDLNDREFAYHVECPACKLKLHSAWHIGATVLSDEEAAGVSTIHEEELDPLE